MKNLKSIREKAGVSQKLLAEALGVDENTVWRWEAGRVNPSVEIGRQIADFFNVSVDTLLNGPIGTEIIMKIREERKELNDLSIEVDMSGKKLIQSITFAGDRVGIGIVYGGDKTLRDVCDELLRREPEIEKIRNNAKDV